MGGHCARGPLSDDQNMLMGVQVSGPPFMAKENIRTMLNREFLIWLVAGQPLPYSVEYAVEDRIREKTLRVRITNILPIDLPPAGQWV